MNIHELREKASKGPYRLKRGTDIYADGYFVGDVLSSNGNAYELDKANAQLIAHTLNNFFPLLEALEDLVSVMDWEGAKMAKAKNVIEKASYVEVEEGE